MICLDCHMDTFAGGEYFMVHADVWARTGLDVGILCVRCTENRIGRELTPSDFTEAPCNFIFSKSWLLIGRQYPEFIERLNRAGMVEIGLEGFLHGALVERRRKPPTA